MDRRFATFERIARSTSQFVYGENFSDEAEHPFETRNIHPHLNPITRTLFDNGHYSQATFEAFKFIDREVARLASKSDSGYKLMMSAFSDDSPILNLTHCSTPSEKDEQKGFQFIFAGSIMAIRNPRGHEYAIHDSLDECLDHLALASILLRRLESAGFILSLA